MTRNTQSELLDLTVNNLQFDMCEPFLKWAGGKRWLVPAHIELFPSTYNRYIEPFLGGGAIFFALRPDRSILGDLNPALIETYEAVQTDPAKVERVLRFHHRQHSKHHYYQVRASNPRALHTKAARFIYLNRTCWNGLYRVNLQGQFNVPIGTKSRVVLERDDFTEISKRLQKAKLRSWDFEKTIQQAQHGDLLFIDPPYTVKHNYNGFLKYNQQLFSWDDQLRLRNSVRRAVDRGAKLVMLNANHESIRALYKGFTEQSVLTRPSRLAANAAYRGIYEELAITSW